MRAAIYTRISNDQTGRGLGVARQLKDCEALSKRHGWKIAKRFDDNDISAYSGKTRPGFEAMLDAMKAGEFEALLCWHTDRLYRNMADLERVIEIADANRIEIRTVQGGTLDLSTSAGRMVARILGSVARQESEHSSERRKRANAQKAASGNWSAARRPFGYTMDGKPLEPEASAIRAAATDVLAGKSIRAVTREWNAAGLRTTGRAKQWSSSMVGRILTRPRNAALVVHQGKVVGTGNWQPIIDEDTHRGLVAYLDDPSRVTKLGFEKRYQGSSTYICGVCGAKLGAYSPSGGKARAYACPLRHVRRQGEALDAYVDLIVCGVLSRPETRTQLARTHGDVDTAQLHAQKTGLQSRQDELASLYADGSITATQLKRGTEKLTEAIVALESELATATRGNPVAGFIAGVERDHDIEFRWSEMTPDIRGKIIDQLMVVTVNRSPRGLRRFDTKYVEIEPRSL